LAFIRLIMLQNYAITREVQCLIHKCFITQIILILLLSYFKNCTCCKINHQLIFYEKKLVCLFFSFITSSLFCSVRESWFFKSTNKNLEEKAKLLGKLAPIQYLYSTKDAVQTAYLTGTFIKDSETKTKSNIAALQTGIQASILHQHDSCLLDQDVAWNWLKRRTKNA
jgi:hypothetical protein